MEYPKDTTERRTAFRQVYKLDYSFEFNEQNLANDFVDKSLAFRRDIPDASDEDYAQYLIDNIEFLDYYVSNSKSHIQIHLPFKKFVTKLKRVAMGDIAMFIASFRDGNAKKKKFEPMDYCPEWIEKFYPKTSAQKKSQRVHSLKEGYAFFFELMKQDFHYKFDTYKNEFYDASISSFIDWLYDTIQLKDEYEYQTDPLIKEPMGKFFRYLDKLKENDEFGDEFPPSQLSNEKESGVEKHDQEPEIKKPRRSNKSERKLNVEFKSFLLKSYNDDPQYFDNKMNFFIEGFKELKSLENKFIDKDTSLTDFKSIFQNKKIPKDNRIKWIGSNRELQWFVHILNSDLEIIADMKNDKWVVTTYCFVNKDGDEFETDQLRNASGERIKRYDLLKVILSKL